MKLIDIDKLFDEYISDFVYSNIGKIKPEEIEDKMPILYAEFGDKPCKELSGKSPNEYYRQYPVSELLELLDEHIEKQIPVSDFLCEAITDSDQMEKVVADKLCADNSEEFTLYLMNFLNEKNSSLTLNRYLEFVLWDYSEPIKELATELLCNFADKVKEDVLLHFKDSAKAEKARLTEILSKCSKDDRVFEILINEFINNPNEIAVYAGYLAKYGDEKALPFLLTTIENEKINYSDFEELRFAIEALGGEYNKERDFSKDKYYKKIKNSLN